MKKRLISLLLFVVMIVGVFAGCSDNSTKKPNLTDYAGTAVLDMSGTDTIKQEVTVKQYVDGDTTHFYYPNNANVSQEIKDIGFIKARYVAINTPESTGAIEPWGKTASEYTRSKLEKATSIVLETDSDKWEADSTKERFLVWIWYKAKGSDVYRNLNLELLQEGLAWGSKAGTSRYGSICTQAINQAKQNALCVYSEENDPDFYYDQTLEVTLKELRTNIEKYNGMRIAFQANVVQYENWSVYLEDYDEETQMYYGITAFYGYNSTFHSILKAGNRVRVVGNITYYEAGGTYQISSLKYDKMDLTSTENTVIVEQGGHKGAYPETTAATFFGEKTVQVNDGGESVPMTYQYGELAIHTSIKMNNLKVVSTYTTNNGGDNDGALSLTCEVDGQRITVRTAVLKDTLGTVPAEYKDQNNVVLASYFKDKTIDVKGVVDYYDGAYQIRAFTVSAFTFHS